MTSYVGTRRQCVSHQNHGGFGATRILVGVQKKPSCGMDFFCLATESHHDVLVGPKSHLKNNDIDVEIQNSRILIQKHVQIRQRSPMSGNLRGTDYVWTRGFWGFSSHRSVAGVVV